MTTTAQRTLGKYTEATAPTTDLEDAIKKFRAVAVALGLKPDAPAADVVAAWEAVLTAFPQPSPAQLAATLSADELARCKRFGIDPKDYATGKAMRAAGASAFGASPHANRKGIQK